MIVRTLKYVNFSDFIHANFFEDDFHLVEEEFVSKKAMLHFIIDLLEEDREDFYQMKDHIEDFVKSVPDDAFIRIRE